MWDRPTNHASNESLEELSRVLERILFIFLGIAAVGILGGAVVIIATMDGSPKSQGGRYFVAIGALVALGWVDRQLMRLVWRRYALIDGDWPRYRRVCLLSGLLLLVVAAFLFGLAYLLP